jgi:phospholipid/cholesterol/gamma-HCH transport system substrate-binding protein
VRRLAILTALLGAIGALVVVLSGASAQGSSSYNFDVIFDDARGLISGQLVKIASAKAGTIIDVKLTPDFKARISASIEGRLGPFYNNATCTIRPEGLIAENYIDCDPGSPASGELRPQGGFPPTVPVKNTSEPVSLLNLFNMFNLPTRQRFMVIVDELGIGTAGRGQDFNDVLRRANPALALARQVISILARQRDQLASLVDSTNTIAAEAAGHTQALQAFLDRSAALSQLTAAHKDNLSTAINRLPGLLAAAQPALQKLDSVAVNGTPLLQELHAAVPTLNKVSADLGPFATEVRPALTALGTALDQATPAVRHVTPVVRVLRGYLIKSLPSTKLMGALFKSLQRTGFAENLLSIFYYVAAVAARYDSVSHIVPAYLISPGGGACGQYATTPVPACNAHFGQAPSYAPVPAPISKPQARRVAQRRETAAQQASGGAALTAAAPAASSTPSAAAALRTAQQLAKQLISKLLSGTGQVSGPQLQQLQSILQGAAPPDQQTLQGLTNYLLR